ncbi:hypothetical protein Tco_0525641 [Tanacetum coccineum]
MSKHKSIFKRQGSLYNTVDNDVVLDRLKFINKGDIYQVYGKSIPDTLITDEIKNTEAYKTFIGISTCLIPPKKGRGKVAQGTKVVGIPKKETVDSKKKRPKKKVSIRDEFNTPSAPKKKTMDSSKKLKGIELLSEAAQFEIDTQKAIKTSRCESRFQHQSGGSSEGTSLRLEVPDEPYEKSADSDEGAGTSPETDDERTDTDVEDQVKGVAEMNIVEEAEEENIERVEKQKDDEELKADEEQKEDDQTGNEQLVVPISTIQKETPNLLQSTSSRSVSSNFDVPHIQQEPFHDVKVSVIPEPTQIPPTIPPTTPPAPPLPATQIPSTQIPNSEAVNSVVQRFTKIEQAVKELKQADHSTTILASIRSHVPSVVEDYLGSSLPDTLKNVLQSHTEDIKKELSEKRDYKDVIKESVQGCCSIVVSIPACHAGDPGSIPGNGAKNLITSDYTL